MSDNWLEVLDEYEVQFIVLDPDSDLAPILRLQPGWVVNFEDREAIFFVRAEMAVAQQSEISEWVGCVPDFRCNALCEASPERSAGDRVRSEALLWGCT